MFEVHMNSKGDKVTKKKLKYKSQNRPETTVIYCAIQTYMLVYIYFQLTVSWCRATMENPGQAVCGLPVREAILKKRGLLMEIFHKGFAPPPPYFRELWNW